MRCLVRILLLAWSQSLATAAEHTSCNEPRTQLGFAVAAVASLEAQLEEARQLGSRRSSASASASRGNPRQQRGAAVSS